MSDGVTYYYKKALIERGESLLTYDTTEDSLSNDIRLTDEPQSLILEVTSQQYNKLLSVALNGAYRYYPDNYNDILYPLIKAGKMELCQEILNCLEDGDNAYLQALRDALGVDVNSPYIPDNATYDAITGGSCDSDSLYGYCKALWLYIHRQNVDLLEQLNEATNQAEQIDTLLQFIPGFEQIPISDFLSWITNLGEYNLDAYNASYTAQIEQEIICELFCIATEDCTLTMQNVWDTLLAKFGGFNFPTLGASFLELVMFMVTGNYPNDRIVYLWSLVQLGIVFVGAEFFNIDTVTQYGLQARAGDPDNDWELFCTTCQRSILIQDDFDSQLNVIDGFEQSAFGNPEPSLLWEQLPPNQNNQYRWFIDCEYVFDNPVTVLESGYDWYTNAVVGGNPATVNGVYLRYYDSNDNLLYALNTLPTDYQTWATLLDDTTVQNVTKVKFLMGNSSNNVITGTQYMDNIRIVYEV
jgi:hypothetical protein